DRALRRLLTERASVITDTVDALRGLEEWDLQVAWDSAGVDRALGRPAQDPPVAPATGAAYLLERRDRHRRASKRSELRRQVAASVHAELRAHAAAAALAGGSVAPCVLHAAYLVPRERATSFVAVVRSTLAAAPELELRGRLTGPFAPYTFCRSLDARP
ncbi:MAG TPA: GvpL/GvpF family gas vesicle protein, partial [Acidimicrobiales bacterium]|nr:GvpL/GvpF family gas vesicle protein [Acidimicrobiales bacterium]